MLQLASIVGAVLILVAYAAHQAGRMSRDTALYNLVNAAGGALLLWVALVARQAGFILLEGVWTAISLAGLVAARKRLNGPGWPGEAC